ncbi:hypothetical protein RhiirB3_433610 [Rhizophagus irregularis]|nr:hypothetical protein RhiirB3_433610 [Rhizophagus irregularis]
MIYNIFPDLNTYSSPESYGLEIEIRYSEKFIYTDIMNNDSIKIDLQLINDVLHAVNIIPAISIVKLPCTFGEESKNVAMIFVCELNRKIAWRLLKCDFVQVILIILWKTNSLPMKKYCSLEEPMKKYCSLKERKKYVNKPKINLTFHRNILLV